MSIRSIVPPVGANWTEWHRDRDAELVRDAVERQQYVSARAAVERAVQHADQLAELEDWEIGGGFWSDEASDHLYDERETLGAETYALAKALLKEAECERKERRP